DRAILACEEALAPGELEVLSSQRVSREPQLVLFIGSQALDRIDAVGERGRAFVRREEAYEVGTAAGDGLAPVAGILLELGLLRRVDMIADNAGNHGASPSLNWIKEVDASRKVADASA